MERGNLYFLKRYGKKNKNKRDGVKMKFSNFSLGLKNTSPTFWGLEDT